MQHMLDKNLETRYANFEQISAHIYFKDFNWDELISLNMEPGYKPKIPNIEYKYAPKPYTDYVNTLSEWEPPENMKEPERIKRIEFNEWFKKFQNLFIIFKFWIKFVSGSEKIVLYFFRNK